MWHDAVALVRTSCSREVAGKFASSSCSAYLLLKMFTEDLQDLSICAGEVLLSRGGLQLQ